jgi:hypothetical protein
MPNPIIDLQRDCELWCDFDTDYFDLQRGKILDRSGNGRHPEAQGGPTLGANGPDNFEAASFDGSDDFFLTDFSPADIIDDEATVFINATPGPSGQQIGIHGYFSVGGGFNTYFRQRQGELGVFSEELGASGNRFPLVQDNENAKLLLNTSLKTNESRLSINGDVRFTSSVSQFTELRSSNNFVIGDGPDDNFSGNIIQVGIWSRSLSREEELYLNRLTEPQRAQL